MLPLLALSTGSAKREQEDVLLRTQTDVVDPAIEDPNEVGEAMSLALSELVLRRPYGDWKERFLRVLYEAYENDLDIEELMIRAAAELGKVFETHNATFRIGIELLTVFYLRFGGERFAQG